MSQEQSGPCLAVVTVCRACPCHTSAVQCHVDVTRGAVQEPCTCTAPGTALKDEVRLVQQLGGERMAHGTCTALHGSVWHFIVPTTGSAESYAEWSDRTREYGSPDKAVNHLESKFGQFGASATQASVHRSGQRNQTFPGLTPITQQRFTREWVHRHSHWQSRGVTKTVGLGLAQSHFDGAESHSPACQWDSGLMVDIKVGFGATRLDGQFACLYRHQLCENHNQLCWSPPPVPWWRAERSGRQVQQAVGAAGGLGRGNNGGAQQRGSRGRWKQDWWVLAAAVYGAMRTRTVWGAACGVLRRRFCVQLDEWRTSWMLRCLLEIEYKAMPVEILQCHGYNLTTTIENYLTFLFPDEFS
ncbi:hypothetical protein GGX14DRAFT_393514 [Mycena pura]|uniref:Uncharacterized protein n=1 Tax=Mycena pura TaxID=153505 RepID=A0AAD6YIL2_9AGAR|nr:hypothetical protein GGX14DRAFT_393514 [Mycena pura]